MSLDVYLTKMEPVECFEFNITHNLGGMAGAAGVYKALWRPEELGIKTAGALILILEKGLATLIASPAKFAAMNPENGWGDYGGLVRTVRRYLAACKDFPEATIGVSR